MEYGLRKPPRLGEVPPAVAAEVLRTGSEDGLVGALRTGPTGKPPIGEEEITKAAAILAKYKQGKQNLEQRVVEDELWWELRHWEAIGRKRQNVGDTVDPTSAWLFNSILNKHADAMDNYPEPIVLPREPDDKDSAKTLSSVLPVILEYNNFEEVYSDNWWEKLKHGTAAYGIFWNSAKDNGLGDIDLVGIDLLKLFWEPGVTDIQRSKNLFIVELVDEETLEAQYPEHHGKLGGRSVDVKEYLYDDQVDTTGKSVVVDWYYKKTTETGRTVLHYAKFVGNTLLFASENEPEYQERGWYDHGKYPVVLDVMFPEKGTPIGFGYVSLCKDPQLYIDKLFGNLLDYAIRASKPRAFINFDTDINEEEYLDWSKPFVHVTGNLDENRLKEITLPPLPSLYVQLAQMKIDEMKDTAANRDVNSGGTGSGVTAAAAIAALQEAGNKVSRDINKGSYRAYTEVSTLCVELVRQFYDERRAFRITGEFGDYEFVELSNEGLREQPVGVGTDGETLFRRPVFDLKIKAQKNNPFAQLQLNEQAKEMLQMGFFNPDRAQEVLPCLELMSFEGVDQVKEYVRQGQTLANVVQQMSQRMDQMAAIIQATTGADMGAGQPGGAAQPGAPAPGRTSAAGPRPPAEDYGSKIVRRGMHSGPGDVL